VYHIVQISYPQVGITLLIRGAILEFMLMKYGGYLAGIMNNSKGRRFRHRTSQMKYFASSKFKESASNTAWGFANKQAIRYRANGWFGLN